MTKNKKNIEMVEGKTDILLIAPHGVNVSGVKKDDKQTDLLTSEIAKKLHCSALINNSIKRTVRNYNSIAGATKDKEFIKNIRSVLDAEGPTLVVWLHGMSKTKSLEESEELGLRGALDCVVGYGQPNRHTAQIDTVNNLVELMNDRCIAALPAADSGYLRGCAKGNMNQWFRQQKEYNDLSKVQSIQLEIREKDFRDSPENIEKTAGIISDTLLATVRSDSQNKEQPEDILNSDAKTKAITVVETNGIQPSALSNEKEPDKTLVDKSFKFLEGIFIKHFHKAMLEAGEYIIKEFYAGDIELARQNKQVKKHSLHQLIRRLQENKGHVPSKTWIYDAVNLVVDEHDHVNLSVYGKLGHSHKVNLTYAKDVKIKKRLIQETVDNSYTVAQLKKRIVEENKKSQTSFIQFEYLPALPMLRKESKKELMKLERQARVKIEHHQNKHKFYEKCHKTVVQALKGKKNPAAVEQKKETQLFGFQEWTKSKNNVNFCTGCENDCIYCYAKEGAYRRKQVELGEWSSMVIRDKEVDKNRYLRDGLVGFPTTHDILPGNIDAYLIILGKLLTTGNEILIVSKPRLDCIQRICHASEFFKDKILFRFTIGAMDDEILSFWEPNAPSYAERKESLKYAFEHGFKTSVSTEPMLESYKIDLIVKDLEPFVSETIWIGKMNHIKRFSKNGNAELAGRIHTIEAGQTDERIKAIYNALKTNPKIRWKDSIKKVIGLQAPPEPGMDN